MYYSFDVNAAARYGVEEAVLLEHIRFWCEKNAANPDCQKEGRCWMYASAARLAEHFPFWSVPQIRRLLKSLVRQGALLEGRFGRFAFDRTLWYAISESAASMFQNRHLQKTNPEHSNAESERAIKDTQKDTQKDSQEDSQHTYTACGGGRAPSPLFEKSGNAAPKTERRPNPFFTDPAATATPASPAQTASQPAHLAPAAQNTQAPNGFERFWQAYPRKSDKRAALLTWKALRPDETLVNAMLAALAAQRESAPWKESGGRYIPHPAKWLSHRRWEDAAPMAQAPAKSYSMPAWAQQTSRPFDPAAAVDILARHRPRRLKRLEA
ncbi:hypothetical protein [Allofournierella massiliensis]|uniref:Uncharacterized protein n=1 Tax=Allofournierella massiliensis TaxID=1650663 RepID=A0A4R1R8I4_9FIRM|nr:hypothetical protein [Fournierella massiliensis]TCL61672.1 hypothetical protein EDD77_101126 [Fournierella massiliensis]